MHTNIVNQRIVITGITGGIAKATAILLAEAGAEVIVSARSYAKLSGALSGISGKVSGYVMDVSDADSVEAFFTQVGSFDHLVTPAATSMLAGIAEMDFNAARALLDSKQWGQMLCVHYGQKSLRKNGSITLFSGTVTQKPIHGASVFAAVGAATEAAARIWALELAPLRINTIVPGIIATDIWSTLTGSDETASQQLSAIGSSLPVNRVGTSTDIAKSVAFLIDNEFVNGISLVVDGGHRLI